MSTRSKAGCSEESATSGVAWSALVRSESDLRSEFRRALYEVTPPAPWLATQVREGLHQRRHGRRLPRGLKPAAVAAAAGVLAIAVAAAIALHNSAPPSSVPATERQTTARYVALVQADYTSLKVLPHFAISFSCATVDQPTCAQDAVLARAEATRFLDDLARADPPPRPVPEDRRLRADLIEFIRTVDAAQAAFDAQDALSAANHAPAGAGDTVLADVFAILYPSRAR